MKGVRTVLLALLTLSCAGGHRGAQNTTIHRGPMPEGGSWPGIYFTNWGQMSISLQGSSAVGEFCDDEASRYGRLEGTAQGNVLSFHWVTNDARMQGRTRTLEGSAILQYSVTQQGERRVHSFDGTWGYEGSNADGGPLRGERSELYTQRFLRGDYQVPCEARTQSEAGAPMSDDDVPDNPEPEDTSMEEETETEPSGDEEGPLDL